MKIEYHLNKKEKIERTLKKLDLEEDSETFIEDCMLASAHLINAALHKTGTLPMDKDIKHNQLFSFLKGKNIFGSQTSEIAEAIQSIENLRPSYVYGKGENGEAAKKAKEMFDRIKKICEGIIQDERETKYSY